METTRLNALPARLTALAVEEFPQRSHGAAAKAASNWHQETQFTCAGIPEEEEGVSSLEEERARRSFQQSLESLCRGTQWRHWQDWQADARTPTQVSLDSTDSDSV